MKLLFTQTFLNTLFFNNCCNKQNQFLLQSSSTATMRIRESDKGFHICKEGRTKSQTQQLKHKGYTQNTFPKFPKHEYLSNYYFIFTK